MTNTPPAMTSRALAALVVDLLDGADCVYDPELHDGPADGVETDAERAAREQVAKEVCGSCPLLATCEVYTERVRPSSGVWAAHTADERRAQTLHHSLLIGGMPRRGKAASVPFLASLDALAADDALDVA